MGNNSSSRSPDHIGPHSLSIKALSWKSENQCLFDFEAKDIIKKKFNIKKPGYLSRSQQNEVQFADTPVLFYIYNDHFLYSSILLKNQSEGFENFLQIGQLSNKFILKNESMDNQELQGICDKSVWLIVNTFKEIEQEKLNLQIFFQYASIKGLYELNIDDHIKIGRVRLRVKEINPEGDFSPQEPEEHLTYNSKNGIKPNEEIQCRICLGDTYTEDNPFISPCACIGSVKHIHMKCLKMWLQNKLVVKASDYYTEYQWKNLECELCKEPLQPYVTYNGKKFPTFTIKNPSCPYLILEKMQKDNNKSKSQLVVNFSTMPNPKENKPKKEKTLLKIGRGAQSHVRINDISVSREHAHFILKNKKFYLKDENSKFGTLALVRSPIPFSSQWNKVSIQIGKTVLQLKLKKTSSLFSCNSLQPEENTIDYQMQQAQFNKMFKNNQLKTQQQPANIMFQNIQQFEKSNTNQENNFGESTFHQLNFNKKQD